MSFGDLSRKKLYLINNHGGLYDCITHTIYLKQFSLAETEAYLEKQKIHWPRQVIVDMYMMLGGVPYYLSLLSPKESLLAATS